MRTFIWYTHFIFSTLLTYPNLLKYRKLKNKLPAEEFQLKAEEYISKWARSQIKFSGANITINGFENIPKDKAVLFVSNHQSNFDIACFIGLIRKPKGYIAKIETLKLPIIRTWMKFIGCVFIDRSDMKKSMQAIVEGIDILKSGHSLVVFPEGTRSKGAALGDFRGGSFKLATKSKVPIIPVTIDGTYKLMEANNSRIKPADVTITIHSAIETKGLSKENEADLADRIKGIISSVLKNE